MTVGYGVISIAWLLRYVPLATAFTSPSSPSSRMSATSYEASSMATVIGTSLRSQVTEFTGDHTAVVREITTPEEDGDEDDPYLRYPTRIIAASVSSELPFGAAVAFDAFSDLPRQPSWSPWLRSVEYVDDDDDHDDDGCRETEWTIRVKGIKFQWRAVSTVLERPHKIEWESTSGMRNRGAVEFLDRENGTACRMILTLTFLMPRVLVTLFHRSNTVQKFLEHTMLGGMLNDFERVVLEEDLGLVRTTDDTVTEEHRHTVLP